MGNRFLAANNFDRPSFVAAHDSATGMLLALNAFLREKPFEGVGAVPTSELYAGMINSIPASWRKKLYTWSGEFSAISEKEVKEIDATAIDRWICDLYPKKTYPAIAIGSCNGAAIHLCAAMGIPWLPQTVLLPVDKGNTFSVDEPKETLEWAKEPAKEFLANNPGWQLHHMMDPNQDRLRVGSIAYFRVKKTRLGEAYRQFIEDRLEPGGSIIVIDCKFQWPVHKIDDRHFFQFGGLGGLNPSEYYYGSEKVSKFLEEVGSGLEKWDAPQPHLDMPEAEWGMETSMAEEVKAFAEENKIPLSTISFDHPQDLSAPIAEFFRTWYAREKNSPNRLLAETFNVLSPYVSLKKRCVPYWLPFIAEGSAQSLETYLKNTKDYDEIYMMILSHGKESAGATSIRRWESLMERAGKKGSFVGTDPQEYPFDMAIYARYSRELREKIPEDFPIPEQIPVGDALELLKACSGGVVEINSHSTL